MEFKGTGKEWDLAELNITDYKQLTIICSEPKKVIAHIYLPDYEITDELKSNALLISKAPELLEALIELAFISNLSDEKQKEVNKLIDSAIFKTDETPND